MKLQQIVLINTTLAVNAVAGNDRTEQWVTQLRILPDKRIYPMHGAGTFRNSRRIPMGIPFAFLRTLAELRTSVLFLVILVWKTR